jgi:hypothetical protein
VNSAQVLIGAVSAVTTFTIAFLVVLTVKGLAAWMARLEARDRAKAEAEGYAACQSGDPTTSNPYVGERSTRFQVMALAWSQGYVRADTERRRRRGASAMHSGAQGVANGTADKEIPRDDTATAIEGR